MILNFGKHEGEPIEDVPVEYLAWLALKCDDELINEIALAEAKRRHGSDDLSTFMIERTVYVGPNLGSLLDPILEKHHGHEFEGSFYDCEDEYGHGYY